MKETFRSWIKKEYPQKAARIISFALPEELIAEAGIELNDHEIFTEYPGFNGWFGSNYGRLILVKDRKLTLKAQPMDQEGYIVYSITKKVSNEIEDGETEVLPITAHRLVADLFLPNYWPELKRNQLHAHHLDHTKMNNRWTNLVLVPIIPFNLHYYLNRVNRIMFSDGAALEEMNPYHILRQTDLTMEELILPLRREPDMLETWNGRPLFIYKLRDSFIGFELTEAEFMRREERKRKEDR